MWTVQCSSRSEQSKPAKSPGRQLQRFFSWQLWSILSCLNFYPQEQQTKSNDMHFAEFLTMDETKIHNKRKTLENRIFCVFLLISFVISFFLNMFLPLFCFPGGGCQRMSYEILWETLCCGRHVVFCRAGHAGNPRVHEEPSSSKHSNNSIFLTR